MKFKCVGCGLYWNVSIYQQIPRGGYICPHCESRLRAGETLPNQRRTLMLNYEVLAKIYKERKNHKLDEWVTFCEWIEGLPYSELITLNQEV